MKVTVVPAQVTTVEDRIAGSLSFSQLLLLSVPVFGGGLLYVVLPPYTATSVYKIVVITMLAMLCGVLAVRIRGKIVLQWVSALLRYNLRPKYYLFNKNSVVYREDSKPVDHSGSAPESITEKVRPRAHLRLGFSDAMQIMATIDNPASQLRFETTKKGGLSVRLTEVEE